MRSALRAAAAAAVLAASALGAQTAAAAPEREGAEYLKSILDGLGFQTRIHSFPITGNRAVAQVSSPDATLPNGPHWQFSSSTFGVQTGVEHPMTGQVVYAGTGATAGRLGAAGPEELVGAHVVEPRRGATRCCGGGC